MSASTNMPTKSTTTKTTVKKPRAPRKAAVKASGEGAVLKAEHPKKEVAEKPVETKVEHHLPKDRYIFATGRRKTAIANVRLFSGKGETLVNKKPLKDFFRFEFYLNEVSKPFELTGLNGQYYFVANINGGGPHAQATALRHCISTALGTISPEIRMILKKNGFLTRDDRKKERKKPGLKRARRSPQWAKR
jgi:small subunit ribosomal protein S9